MKKLIILLMLVLLAGCAMNKNERQANSDRLSAWQNTNAQRTFKQTEITGITQITGENITITTWRDLELANAPSIQYDTSDTEMVKAGIGMAEKALTGALIVEGIRIAGDALRPDAPTVVTQPEPIIVTPEIIYSNLEN